MFIAALFLCVLSPGQIYGQEKSSEVIVEWNFNDPVKQSTVNASLNPADYAPDVGSGELSLIGGAALYQFTVEGEQVVFATGVTGEAIIASQWHNGAGTKYWQIRFSTQGYQNINFSSAQRSSTTGPRDFQVQFSLNGTTWTDTGASLVVTDNISQGHITEFELGAELEDQETVYLRWIMTSNINQRAGTGEHPADQPVEPGGTNRIDDIIVRGQPFAYIVSIDDVDGVGVDCGTSGAEALNALPSTTTITDSQDNTHTVSLNWTIDAYNGSVPGTYNATGVFALPPGVSQSDPPLALEVHSSVSVQEGDIVPEFAPIGPLCQGETPPSLPLTSLNGIPGSWDPDLIDTSESGTALYTFTPNEGHCAVPTSLSISVEAGADPGEISGPELMCEGDTHQFTTSGDPGGTWSSSNTAAATVDAANGWVTARGEGSTNIIYTVEGCGDPAHTSFPLDVEATASPGVIRGPELMCEGDTHQFTATGDAGGRWNSTSSIRASINPNTGMATAMRPGTTLITYTVEGCNNPEPAELRLWVEAAADPGEILGPDTMCVDEIVQFSSTGDEGGVWGSSNTGTVSIDAATGRVTAHQAGHTTLTYTVDGCSGEATAYFELEVEEIIVPDFDAPPPLCQGIDPPALPATSNNGISGTWSPEIIDTSTSGIFMFVFTPDDGRCIHEATINIEILSVPEVDAGSDQDIHFGETATLNEATATGEGTPSFRWEPADLLDDPTVLHPTTLPLEETTVFTLTVTGDNGCAHSDQLTVTVKGSPIESIDDVSDIRVPCGTTIVEALNALPPSTTITDSHDNSHTVSLSWDIDGYNGSVPGAYVATGVFALPPGVIQSDPPLALEVNSSVIVEAGNIIPEFAPIGPLCQGETPPPLLTTSLNGVEGSWDPAVIDTSEPGSQVYAFSPQEGFCALDTLLEITVEPLTGIVLSSEQGTNEQSICIGAAITTVVYTIYGAATTEVSGLPDGVSWSEDQGTLRIEGTPNVPGEFTFEVSATGACGEDGVEGRILVSAASQPGVLSENQWICVGETPEEIILSGHTGTVQWMTSTGDDVWSYIPDATGQTLTPDQMGELIQTTYFRAEVSSGACPAEMSNEVSITVHPLPGATASSNSPVCEGQQILLSAGPDGMASYLWSGPDGFTSDHQNPEIDNTATSMAGEYRVEVSNLEGCSVIIPVGVVVMEGPEVFAGNDQDIHFGETATLDGATATGEEPLNVQWEPADLMENPTVLNPTTLPLEETTVFTLTVTGDNGCAHSDQITVTVEGGPLEVSPTATPAEVCPGAQLQLSANASGGSGDYTYSWTSEPEGFVSDLPDPVVSPEVSTTYFVEVNDGITTESGQVTVVVHPLPVATANSNSPLCQGESISLSAGPDGMASYLWTGPDGFTSEQQNPVIDNAATSMAGEYRVLVSSENGCQAEASVEASILQAPEATASSNSPVCEGESIMLSAGAEGVASFFWTGPGGFFSDDMNPVIENAGMAMAGEYLLEVSNLEGCSVIIPVGIELMEGPEVFAGSDQSIPYGETATLNEATATGEEPLNFQWEPAELLEDPTMLNPTTLPLEQTTVFTLTVTGDNGCAHSDQMTVTVEAPPSVVPPTVITSDATEVTAGSARIGGEITEQGGEEAEAQGVYVGTDPDPAETGTMFTAGLVNGRFSTAIGGLDAGTTYYFVAYATNSAGTGWGEVKHFVTLEGREGFHIPNAFMPGSQIPANRAFKPSFEVSPFTYSLTVYSRWGEKVFATEDPNEGWDGRIGNSEAAAGGYVYEIYYIDPQGRERRHTGTVMLIR